MPCAKISISTLLRVKGKLWWVVFVAHDLGRGQATRGIHVWHTYGIQCSAAFWVVYILDFISFSLSLSLQAISLWPPHFCWWKSGSNLSVLMSPLNVL